jgi:hypothetical protein
MLVPDPWNGILHDSDLDCLKSLPGNTWCSLYRNWFDKDPLPSGYDLYVISYYLEALDIDWIIDQCASVGAPIILLSDNNYYDFPAPPNLHCYTFYSWHRQLDLMSQWFPDKTEKNITHKASAVCHRVTQSKLIVITALIQSLGLDQCIIVLNDWLEDANVHNRQPTGSHKLDDLANIFWETLYGNKITFDDFDQTKNQQRITSDPWSNIYQSSAINFTNESFHYSYMHTKHGKFCYPGPFLTEKTFKCLLGGTGFVPVGQYDTYRSLGNLGFQFEYGFPTEFDQVDKNITRLEKIIDLIHYFKGFTYEEIFEMTEQSSLHNQDHIFSGKLFEICQNHNDRQTEIILEKFSH